MISQKISAETPSTVLSKFSDYAQFSKFRLSLLVVFSAVMGYLMAAEEATVWSDIMALAAGGFFVTAASNGFNQVMERDLDKLMTRTSGRPLPGGRMSVAEAVTVAMVMGAGGVMILGFFMNWLTAILGLLALLLYTLAYTPVKRVTPFAVFVGAVPGAMPPLLGWTAATGSLEFGGWLLFTIQFIWQFPHFWAIAWVMDEDYRKAGFRLLPSGKRDKASAFQTLVYTLGLIPLGLLPWHFQMGGTLSALLITFFGLLFFIQAFHLFRTCTQQAAARLMFGSFLYLPLVQLALVLDKLL